MKSESSIEFFTIIAGRKIKEDLLGAVIEAGGRIINTIYGRGSVKASLLMDVLGLVPEEDKVILTFLISHEKSEALFQTLVEEFNFNKPNTGIAFTIPVEGLSY